MGVRPANIELRVDELVLHGFSPGDRYRIGEAAELELGRLFAERGAPPSLVRDAEITRLDGGSFDAGPDSGAEAIGVRLAQAVYGGLDA
jgi:hypothetical protein